MTNPTTEELLALCNHVLQHRQDESQAFDFFHEKLATALLQKLDREKDHVLVPRETIKRWKDQLEPYWFSDVEGESYNNDGVVELNEELAAMLSEVK